MTRIGRSGYFACAKAGQEGKEEGRAAAIMVAPIALTQSRRFIPILPNHYF
jgi:hypothetical protein